MDARPGAENSTFVDPSGGDGRTKRTGTLIYHGGAYRSPPVPVALGRRLFPSLAMYQSFLRIVWRSSTMARRGRYDFDAWVASSVEVLRALEGVGVTFDIRGIEHLQRLEGGCVVVGNHMSTLETVVLPAIIGSVRKVTFILKDTLYRTPLFRHVVRAVDAIGVSRTNPRADLKVVLERGGQHLRRGSCLVVFPQTTRAGQFDAQQFNTIGVKLAQRAQVPVVPLAIRSDAWRNGRWQKDLGSIDPSRPVRFVFGHPLVVAGRGQQEHLKVIDFIETHLAAWVAEDGDLF